MTKVYLDNNVLVDIECGSYNLSDFLKYENVEYYFSSSHIDELIEGRRLKSLSVNNRLSLIEKLCNTNYILPGNILPEIYPMSPQRVYEIGNSPLTMLLHNKINEAVSNIIVDREKFLEILRIKKVEINNIPPQSILKELDNALITHANISIESYLKTSEAIIGLTIFDTLFNLLDSVCYYKDKQTEHSNIARLHDAFHAYYAQLCDYFVSQDKRMRNKTEAVYRYLGIKTTTLSTTDYLKDFSNRLEKNFVVYS